MPRVCTGVPCEHRAVPFVVAATLLAAGAIFGYLRLARPLLPDPAERAALAEAAGAVDPEPPAGPPRGARAQTRGRPAGGDRSLAWEPPARLADPSVGYGTGRASAAGANGHARDNAGKGVSRLPLPAREGADVPSRERGPAGRSLRGRAQRPLHRRGRLPRDRRRRDRGVLRRGPAG